jgi:hypothetical protein
MNTKTTLVLAILAAAVVSYVALVDKPWETSEAKEEPKTQAVALYDPKPADADRVEVLRRDGKKLVFVKNTDDAKSWKMIEPMETPATESSITSMITKVGEIKFDRKYGPGDKDRPSDKVAGFDKPIATVRLLKGDKELASVTVGDPLPTGKGSYFKVGSDVKVKIDDKDAVVSSKDVLESDSDLSDAFMAKLDTFRDKNVLKFDLANVKRMTVEGDRNYVLVKNGENWVLESPVRGRADKSKAEGVVRALTSLYVSEFKDDAPASYVPYGLEPARMKVVVETEKTVPPKSKPGDPYTQPADTQPSTQQISYELAVGLPTGEAANKQFFARLGGKPWVFSISDYTYKQLATEVVELQDKKIAPIETAKVKSIKADTPEGSVTLSKGQTGTWTDTENNTADQVAVQDLLKAISGLQAVNFIDPTTELITMNWDQPRARLSITQEGSLNPVTVLVGPASASGKMVFVRNAADDAVAAVREDAVVQLLAGPVAYRDRSVLRFDRPRTTRVEVSQPGKGTVALVQKNNEWTMAEPAGAPVDNEAIRNLMQDISSLQAKRVVGSGDRAKFGLDAPAVTVAAYVEPVTPPATQPAATAPAAEPTPKPAAEPVAVATQPASTRPAKSVPERIKQIEELLEYQKSNPKENPLATQMLNEELAKLKAQQTQPAGGATAATQPAGARPAKTLAERIKQIEELIEYQKTNPKENPLATQMLHEELAKLKAQAATQPAGEAVAVKPTEAVKPVETAKGPQPTHRLFLAQKDGKTYGAVDGKEMIYELDGQIFTDATAELHDRQVTRFETNLVSEVQFAKGDSTLTFRKSGEDWKYVLDSVLPIDKDKLTKALDELKDVKTHRFVSYQADDLAAYGLDKPAQRFSVAFDGGNRIEVLISGKGPEGDADKSVFAAVAGQKKVFLLKPDQVEKLSRDLDDFEKSSTPAAPVNPGMQGMQGMPPMQGMQGMPAGFE